MSESAPDDGFGERWGRAVEKLHRENSLDGFCEMYESGEVSEQELFSIAYQHWYQSYESRAQFLSSLASHRSEDLRRLWRELSAFITDYEGLHN